MHRTIYKRLLLLPVALLLVFVGCDQNSSGPGNISGDRMGGANGHAPSDATMKAKSNAGLITNVSAQSGAGYQTATFAVGAQQYVDRDYTFTDVPSSYDGAAYIQTANDDKAATDDPFLAFTLTREATVGVAYDKSLSRPSWLSDANGWSDTGVDAEAEDYDGSPKSFRIYEKSFSAGTVELPGNDSGSTGSMYGVLALGSGELVSNVSAQSGANYEIDTLAVNLTQYIDRDYTFLDVPSAYDGAPYIRTANDDKGASDDPFLSFDLSREATVAVLYDSRLSRPSWLSDANGWVDTGVEAKAEGFNASNPYFGHIYEQTFSAGTIELPGNDNANNASMYSVAITDGPGLGEGDPGGGDPGPPQATDFGPPSSWSQTTTLTPNASGPNVTLTATLFNKDGSQQQISATAGPGERVRATDQNGNLTKVSVREFTDGCTALENMYVDQSGNADLRNVSLTLNESSPRELFSGDIDLIARTRWPFWHQPPTAKPLDKSLVPPYGAGAENKDYLSQYNSSLNTSYNASQVQNIGMFYKAMGTTGGRADLGLLTQWDVAYVKNPSANNAEMLRGQGDAAAAWHFHALDPNTNMMVKVTDYPKLDVSHANSPNNPAEWANADTPFNMEQARAHAPEFGYLPALVFQTEFDIEETQYWANYLATYSDHYRLNGGAGIQNIYHSQTRGYGWSLRQTVQAAVVSKKFDTPFKDYFATLVDQYGDEINGIMDQRIANNQIRILHKTIYPAGPGAYAIGPWQDDFVGMSLGFGAYLGYDKLKTAFMKYGEFFTQRINATPHEFASVYDIPVRRTKDANGALVADWQEAIDVSVGYGFSYFDEAVQYPEGSLEFNQVINEYNNVSPGALAGHPASNVSYAAYYGAVLGFTKYFGVNGSDTAWQTFNDNLIMSYSGNPMFFIDPNVAQQRRPISN